LFQRGTEFPLAERVHGVGVELFVDAVNQLNAVHRAIPANHGIKHNLARDAFVAQRRRILRIHFALRRRALDIGACSAVTVRIGAKLGKIQNPASRGTVQVGHVHKEFVDFF
jgi:hypothetical protein